MLGGIIMSVGIAVLWSLAPILHKMIYSASHISPKTMMIVSGMFYMVALAVYGCIHYRTTLQDLPKLSMTTTLLIAVAVLLTAFLSNLLYYHAIKVYPAFLVTGISYSAPLFTVLFAFLILKEQKSLSALTLLGASLVVAGVLCLALSDSSGSRE